MSERKGYSVIKFISHKEKCYKGNDYVEGHLLAHYLKRSPHMPKKQLLIWMREIIRLLAQYHKLGSGVFYQYVNPFMIVVRPEELPLFIDIKAEESKEMLMFVQKKEIKSQFLPAAGADYNRADLSLDLYGLGKSLQYILAHTIPQPALTGREEHQFRKIIKKCLSINSTKTYQSISSILREFPKVKKQIK